MCCSRRVSTYATELLLFLMVYLILAYIQKKRKAKKIIKWRQKCMRIANSCSQQQFNYAKYTTEKQVEIQIRAAHTCTNTRSVLLLREILTGGHEARRTNWQVALRLPIKRKFVSAKCEGVSSLHRFVALFTIQICEPLLEPWKAVLSLFSSFQLNSKVLWARSSLVDGVAAHGALDKFAV